MARHLGVAVAIGARIGAIAGSGEVLVSSTVKRSRRRSELAFDDRGEHALRRTERVAPVRRSRRLRATSTSTHAVAGHRLKQHSRTLTQATLISSPTTCDIPKHWPGQSREWDGPPEAGLPTRCALASSRLTQCRADGFRRSAGGGRARPPRDRGGRGCVRPTYQMLCPRRGCALPSARRPARRCPTPNPTTDVLVQGRPRAGASRPRRSHQHSPTERAPAPSRSDRVGQLGR